MTNKKIKSLVYGVGGYDETKPDNNVIEIIYYTAEELLALEEEQNKRNQKEELLNRLGITEEEAKLLLG
jgi:hypothetical protein